MFNLIKTKEQLNNLKNKVSLGVLGAVALQMIPQTARITRASNRRGCCFCY